MLRRTGRIAHPANAAAHPDPTGQLAYVSVGGAFGLPAGFAVIDTATGSLADYTTLPQQPTDVAVNPAGTRVYLTTPVGSVMVVNPRTDKLIGTFPVGATNRAVAFNPSGTRAYIADDAGSSTVDVVDTATQSVIADIPAGGNDIAVNRQGTRAYSTGDTGLLSVIDTRSNTMVDTVHYGQGRGAVAVNPAGTRVYTADFTTQSVYVIDTATDKVAATISVPFTPLAVAVNPSGTRAYVTSGPTDRISVIDTGTNTVVASAGVGYGVDVAPNAIGSAVFVAVNGIMNLGSVKKFDTATDTVTATTGLAGDATGVALGPTLPTTATALTVMPPGPVTQGTAVTLTATVTPAIPGTVQFYDFVPDGPGPTRLGAPVVIHNGTASFTTSMLSGNSHTLTAAFEPSRAGILRSASAPVTLFVNP